MAGDTKEEDEERTASSVYGWISDGAFWRDVAVQVIGTLIAAGVIAIVAAAVLAGSYPPQVRFTILAAILSFTVLIFFAALWLDVTPRLTRRLPWGRRSQRTRTVSRLIWVGTFVVCWLLHSAIMFPLAIILAQWTGYTAIGWPK